jgi:hypothetical protein
VPAQAIRALDASLLAQVPAGTYGPYLARSNGAALLVWAAPDGQQRKWWAQLLDASSAPRAKPRLLATAPLELDLVAVEPIADGGFVIVSTHRQGDQTAIEALSVDAAGKIVGAPVALDSARTEVRWIDAVPTASGALVLWARQKGAVAELSARALAAGSARGEAVRITSARAWQAVAVDGGAQVAVSGEQGIRLLRLDGSGKQLAETPLSARPAELDVDAVLVGDRILVAWSDRAELDQRIRLALLDRSGKLLVPAKAALASAIGDQALLRLVPPLGSGPAYLAWELVGEPSDGARVFRISRVDADGAVGAVNGEVRIAADDGTTPELAASARGLAALTLARSCEKSQSAESCAQAERLPMFVELDRDFSPLAAEPLRLSALSGGAVELAWGLGCSARGCSALAALGSDPAPIYAVRLASRSEHWLAPAGRVEPQPPPRPASVEALSAIDPLADIAATRVGATTLAAWITYFDPTTPWQRLTKPAPDGRFEPLRALLQVRALPDSGEAPAAQTISLRARSLGGVALAAGAAQHGESLLVWTALDNGVPQVFATVVGADGKKLRQKMLTRSRGEKSDVAVASVGDGWVVAWVDERHADPELYAAKLNRFLQNVGPERRITAAAGAATGISMLPVGSQVLVAWADARDAEQPGAADPYVIALRAQDAAPLGKEQRLATTRPHSFSPKLARLASGAAIAWIEAEEGGLRVGRLDDRGGLVGPLATIDTNGAASGVSLECDAEQCHVVAAVERGGRSELRAALWAPTSAAGKSARLLVLPGPASQNVSPTLLGGTLFYADQIGDRGRVRRMTIEWR